MTGPEHYRVAEEALRQAKTKPAGCNLELHLTRHAQVHAILALAAATALGQEPKKWLPDGSSGDIRGGYQ